MADDLTLVQGLIAIGAAVRAATKTVLDAAKASNKRRDTVILGTIKKEPLTKEHRQLIMYNDWLPISVGAAILCLTAAVVLVALPWYVQNAPWYLKTLSWI